MSSSPSEAFSPFVEPHGPASLAGSPTGRIAQVRRLFEPAAAHPDPEPAARDDGSLALALWDDEETDDAPTEIPPVEPWAHRFAQAVVEAIGGVRPVTQLVRWTTRGVYRDLERRVRVLSEARHGGRAASLVRPQVSSVRVCHPTEEVAEVSVTVRHGHRTRALAARLEFRRGLWCCTALEIG